MAHPIIPHIAALVPRFCTGVFGTDDAVAALGAVAGATDAERVIVQPRGVPADGVTLVHEDLEEAAHFLSDIEYTWAKPQRIGLDDLQKAFGPVRIVSRLEATAYDTYLFDIRKEPLMGLVTLAVQREERGTLTVTRVTLRRLAPDPPPAGHGRAVRFVVLADLGATEDFGSPTPLSHHLG